MNIYKLTNNLTRGYDTYDSAIVAAKSPAQAVKIPPSESIKMDGSGKSGDSWPTNPKWVGCEYVGKAASGTVSGVILASFNAG